MPTIKEIAQKAGVSLSTVSRALNNKKGVSPKMRDEIIQIADKMSYFPASVNSDSFKSVQRAVSYLIQLGHRKIAFILGQLTSMFSIDRLEAYRAAFRENALSHDPKYIVESDFSKKDGFRLMGELLDLPDPPTSVICINDNVTPGALHQIKKRGLKIPEDISVVAIGSSDILELFEPPLTTIKTPVIQVGQTAAHVLIQLIETGYRAEKHVGIPAELIIRDSTGVCGR